MTSVKGLWQNLKSSLSQPLFVPHFDKFSLGKRCFNADAVRVRAFCSWQEGGTAGIAALLPGLPAAAKGEKIQPGAYLE